MKSLLKLGVFTLLLAATSSPAHGQFNGANTLGDFGVLSGSQPGPGFYFSPFYYRYDIDDVIDGSGDAVDLLPSEDPADLSLNAFAPILYWVSGKKIFGANYGVMMAVPFANTALDVPVLGKNVRTSFGIGDIYLRPVDLGWHTDRADYMTGLAVTMPTGRYGDPEEADVSLGMWSFEVFAGTSLYLDEAHSWHLATTAFWETHSTKKDTDERVGDLLTFEGGAGKTLSTTGLTVGVAYYAQWKLTEDDFGAGFTPPAGVAIGKHRAYGVGPDITVPLATGSRLYGYLNARYIWDVGTRTRTEGRGLSLTATFPIPSVPLS